MKRVGLMMLAIAIVGLFAPLTRAGAIGGGSDRFTLNFDEFGNGFASVNGGPTVASPGVMLPDPTQPGNPLVLTFLLPQVPVNAGEELIMEPGGGVSDVIRWTNAAGATSGLVADRMIYYSDNIDGIDSLADTSGLPVNFNPGSPFVNEIGAEGSNGFSYFSGGAPGVDNDYIGVSDGVLAAVPLPASAWAGLVLVAGMGIVRYIRRAAVRIAA